MNNNNNEFRANQESSDPNQEKQQLLEEQFQFLTSDLIQQQDTAIFDDLNDSLYQKVNFGVHETFNTDFSQDQLLQDNILMSQNPTLDTQQQQQQQRVESMGLNLDDMNNTDYYLYQHNIPLLNDQTNQHLCSSTNNLMVGTSLLPFCPPQQQQQQQQQPQPARKEQDVFGELLSLAANRNNNGWPNNTNINPFANSLPNGSNPMVLLPQEQQHMFQTQQQVPTNLDLNINASTSSSFVDDKIYNLEIVQQPLRARMCGFGDKDRRPISPPPILKLTVLTKEGQIFNPETFDVSFLIVMCDIYQQPADVHKSQVPAAEVVKTNSGLTQVVTFPTTMIDEKGKEQCSSIRMRNLVGASVVSATKLYDLDGKLGIFFVFQDVSLRTEGVFRLKFSLIDIGSPHSRTVNTTSVSRVLKVVQTDPFTVYTAKKFPGVVQSTALSRCFAQQGIKIPIRKETTTSKSKKKAEEPSTAAAGLTGDETDGATSTDISRTTDP